MSGFLRWLGDRFDYYKHPEGEDPLGKLIGFGQYGLLTGGSVAIYDAIMYSHCANAPQFLNTFGYWVVPLTGMCLSFSAVTYTLTNLRKKDDKYNYFAGALSSGAILHAWQKCIFTSGWATALFVAYALLKKQNIQDGRSRKVFLLEDNPDVNRKALCLWRTLPYRDYTSKPWWPHDKTDYYVHHY